ncbi:MAG TPA: FecR domain-containing protein [Flavobacterium sp.]|jgi:ferric-dicitrate binding protein FerR (iron transport regulator)
MKEDTQLARWLAGEMDDSELHELEASPEYPTLLRIRDQFSRLQQPEVDQDKILKNVLITDKRATRIVPLYKKKWFQIAAVLLVLLGVATTFVLPKTQVAPNGEMVAFTLPDNSEVHLKPGSEAEYSTFSWNNNRRVELTGEAYFKVAKGKRFDVHTVNGTVTVLGTKFSVRARENRLDVICYQGKVQVLHDSDLVILTPGDYISYSGTARTNGTVESVEPEWLHGELAFHHESLKELLAELQRQYDVQITTTSHGKQLFSGSLPADNLDAALEIVALTYHLEVRKGKDGIALIPTNVRQ